MKYYPAAVESYRDFGILSQRGEWGQVCLRLAFVRDSPNAKGKQQQSGNGGDALLGELLEQALARPAQAHIDRRHGHV